MNGNRKPAITVVGDVMLDRYLIGDVTRLNPEAAGAVMDIEREDLRLGGAASVAMLGSSLGAEVTLAGVIGRDLPGGQVLDLLDDHRIAPHLWADSTRPTTNKTRFILRGQLRPDRFDFESKAPIPGDAAKYLAVCPIGDTLLVQDYGKGVCTDSLLRSLLSQATAAGVPILVDPARGRDWQDYDGCTVIKANRIEAADALGCHVGDPPAMMARRLAIRQGCHVVVTAGELGVWWSDGPAVRRVPAVQVQVRDVCGAGDTVLATLGVAMATGGTIDDACRLAVRMAAEQVGQVKVKSLKSGSNQFPLTSKMDEAAV
jgi:rfaE bifunctional protein kinase chain/domain